MNLRHVVSCWLARFFPKKTLGQRGEAAAARYLRRRGYKVLARGDRFGPGELDLVMLDRETIVFVEVKTRQSHDAGHPAEAVDQQKQRRLTRLAVTFLKRHGLLERPARFDVVAVTWPDGQVVPHDRAHPQRLRGGGEVGVLFVTPILTMVVLPPTLAGLECLMLTGCHAASYEEAVFVVLGWRCGAS